MFFLAISLTFNHHLSWRSLAPTPHPYLQSFGLKLEDVGDLPNIVAVILDDVGMNDLGYLSKDLHSITPTIDALAGEGVKLENFYTMQVCTPTRGMFFQSS